MTNLTRTDCKRDDVKVICPTAILIGFGIRHCKRGFWVQYEIDNQHFVGRSIGRVTCEGTIYIEVAQASNNFSSAFIRWVKPEDVREIRRSPPRKVFDFFADKGGWYPEAIFRALEYGVSDMHDQMQANEEAEA